jgi:hypothetical protein
MEQSVPKTIHLTHGRSLTVSDDLVAQFESETGLHVTRKILLYACYKSDLCNLTKITPSPLQVEKYYTDIVNEFSNVSQEKETVIEKGIKYMITSCCDKLTTLEKKTLLQFIFNFLKLIYKEVVSILDVTKKEHTNEQNDTSIEKTSPTNTSGIIKPPNEKNTSFKVLANTEKNENNVRIQREKVQQMIEEANELSSLSSDLNHILDREDSLWVGNDMSRASSKPLSKSSKRWNSSGKGIISAIKGMFVDTKKKNSVTETDKQQQLADRIAKRSNRRRTSSTGRNDNAASTINDSRGSSSSSGSIRGRNGRRPQTARKSTGGKAPRMQLASTTTTHTSTIASTPSVALPSFASSTTSSWRETDMRERIHQRRKKEKSKMEETEKGATRSQHSDQSLESSESSDSPSENVDVHMDVKTKLNVLSIQQQQQQQHNQRLAAEHPNRGEMKHREMEHEQLLAEVLRNMEDLKNHELERRHRKVEEMERELLREQKPKGAKGKHRRERGTPRRGSPSKTLDAPPPPGAPPFGAPPPPPQPKSDNGFKFDHQNRFKKKYYFLPQPPKPSSHEEEKSGDSGGGGGGGGGGSSSSSVVDLLSSIQAVKTITLDDAEEKEEEEEYYTLEGAGGERKSFGGDSDNDEDNTSPAYSPTSPAYSPTSPRASDSDDDEYYTLGSVGNSSSNLQKDEITLSNLDGSITTRSIRSSAAIPTVQKDKKRGIKEPTVKMMVITPKVVQEVAVDDDDNDVDDEYYDLLNDVETTKVQQQMIQQKTSTGAITPASSTSQFERASPLIDKNVRWSIFAPAIIPLANISKPKVTFNIDISCYIRTRRDEMMKKQKDKCNNEIGMKNEDGKRILKFCFHFVKL